MSSTLYSHLNIVLFSRVFSDISMTSLEGNPCPRGRFKGADVWCTWGHFSFLPKLEVCCTL